MAETLDRVKKLIALALNNPDEEEARSAAMKAVSLIVADNMTIEGNVPLGFSPNFTGPKRWRPDDEFDQFWESVVSPKPPIQQDDLDRDPWAPQQHSGAQELKAAHVDTDFDDSFNAMRTRIKIAWRAIQGERARLKMEIYNHEVKYGYRYPRQEPKDWEKANDE